MFSNGLFRFITYFIHNCCFSETGGDLNDELSRVVTELESAIHERKRQAEGEEPGVLNSSLEGNEDDGVEEKALEVGVV